MHVAPGYHRHLLAGLVLLVCLGLGTWAQACQIPVFRYALERWEASPYDVLIFHRGPLTAEHKALADALEQRAQAQVAHANLRVQRLDLDNPELEPAERALVEGKHDQLPLLVVRYADDWPNSPSAWVVPFTAAHAAQLVDSPLRREIARKLLAGDSAVWLLVESGDAQRDQAAHDQLRGMLNQMEKELALPEIDQENDPTSRLQSNLALKLAFSIVRVPRQAPAEAFFVSSLLQLEGGNHPTQEPLAIPVYGRGRALAVFTQTQMTKATVADVCAFLVGPCSCQVKELNPGTDLLIAADWDALLEDRLVQDPEVPPLFSLAGAVHPGAAGRDLAQAGSTMQQLERQARNSALPSPTAAEASGSSPVIRNLALALAALAAVVLAGSLWALRKRREV
mgnify:CR=1 FL=1